MIVNAHNPPGALKQRVRTPSLVIIEFVLDGLSHVGTSGQLLYLSLVQNYTAALTLHHELIFFDVNESCLDEQAVQLSKTMEKLQNR